jgi:hypothetical protein
MEYYEYRAMNTDIVLAAEGEPQSVQTGFACARDYIEASEARFTRFAARSELSAQLWGGKTLADIATEKVSTLRRESRRCALVRNACVPMGRSRKPG